MGFLAGKRILITGLLSNRSIAYGVAKACHREGAELALTYQNDRFKDRISKFADEFGAALIFPCDVAEDAQIEQLFAELGKAWEAQFDKLFNLLGLKDTKQFTGKFICCLA